MQLAIYRQNWHITCITFILLINFQIKNVTTSSSKDATFSIKSYDLRQDFTLLHNRQLIALIAYFVFNGKLERKKKISFSSYWPIFKIQSVANSSFKDLFRYTFKFMTRLQYLS